MAVQSTELSIILNRMKRYQTLSSVENQFLIRDLDASLRTLRRDIKFPWNLIKDTLKVFSGVLEYPVPSGYDDLAYLDTPKSESVYTARARFRFTSLKEFYENPDGRNDIAEIRDANDIFLGVRYSPSGTGSHLLSTAEVEGDYSGFSGDVTAVAEDSVVFKKGNGSIKVSITKSADTATINNTFASFTETDYKRFFHFRWIFLDAVPTSITMRFKVDANNFIETTGITTQFSGQPLVADAWNLVAHDLNEATETGTISTSSVWAQEDIILIGAATGTYYVDDSNIRGWTLMDLWYYSKFNIATVSATTSDQEFFFNSSDVFSTDSKLVGDLEWADVIMTDAMVRSFSDAKDTETLPTIIKMRDEAMEKLAETYPDMKPVITTLKYRIETDFNHRDVDTHVN